MTSLATATICLASVPCARAEFRFGPPDAYNTVGPAKDITTADLNRDGLPDVVIGTAQGIVTLLNNGGSLASAILYPSGEFGPAAVIVAADFDGDGLPDIAIANSSSVGVLLNDGHGTLASLTSYGVSLENVGAASLVAADFDRDGQVDLALSTVTLFGVSLGITIFRNQGAGSFAQEPTMTPSERVYVISADANSDGYPDLITYGNTVSVLINNRDGAFTGSMIHAGAGARQAIATDLNRDGLLDVVLAASQSVRLGVLLNQGAGAFSPTAFVPYFPLGGNIQVGVSDFDGDGRVDLVATQGDSIAIQKGRGDGTFDDPVTVYARSGLGSSFAVDLDGNGATDLIVSNPAAASIDVLLNQRLPSFDLLRLSTDHGGNAGSVTLTIFGRGIPENSTVKLVCSGQANVLGINNSVSPDSRALTATLNLVGATPGLCDVVVTKPGGTTVITPKQFTVESAGAAQVRVYIVGWDKIRIGRPQTYHLILVNTGSIDSAPGFAWLGVPSGLGFRQMSGAELYPSGSTDDPEFKTPSAEDPFLLFATAGVPPGASQSAPIQLTVPPNASPSRFRLTGAWQEDLGHLSLDDFLGLERIPFIPYPANGCPACENAFRTELVAHTNLLEAYHAFRGARQDFWLALAFLPVSIGQTIAAIAFVEEAGLPILGGVVLSTLLDEAKLCAENLYFDVTRGFHNCLHGLKDHATIAGSAAADLLNEGISKPQRQTLAAFKIKVDVLTDGIDGLAKILDAYGSEQAALAAFLPKLGTYRLARMAYEACLSPSNCHSPASPPPPSPLERSFDVEVVSSFDPNEKLGLEGAGPPRYIAGTEALPYSVLFANQESATAPAQRVVIADQLDLPRLDLATLQLGGISFGEQVVPPPPLGQKSIRATVDLRPAIDLLVAINAGLDRSNGQLGWSLQCLDPSTGLPPKDPTAGFLPPGVGGSVFFTIAPKQGLPTGVQIQNRATIVFDANPPIPTQTWRNTLDNDKPTSRVLPLPASSLRSFTVTWAGNDVGSGVHDYTVFVSDNGGPFTPFLTNTTGTSAVFTGQPGHAYSFYSVARDLVGNIEDGKTTGEAMTLARRKRTD